MEDQKIVDLYFARSEDAIVETDLKYGRYCMSIAYAVLYSESEAEECKDDTYLKVWNAIPPERPALFKAFLGKIARRTALDRYDYEKAKKRGADAVAVFDEALDALPDASASDPAEAMELRAAINGFLASLKKRERILFLQRYYYFCTVSQIARQNEMSETAVKVALYRTRLCLKGYLEERGITL